MTTWDYIRDLFRPYETVAICIRLDGAIRQRIVTAEAACAPRYQAFLRAMNAQGADIYISMNPLRCGSNGRTKADIAMIQRIYLDLDHDGDRHLQLILNSSPLPQPNYILTTSPGKYQVIWNVHDFAPDQAENLMRFLVPLYGADPAATDIARILRLPGLHNKKHGLSFPVVARKLTSHVYTPVDFPVPTLISPQRTSSHRAGSTLRNTPSHRDWAYCCRALWNAPDSDAVADQLIQELVTRATLRHKPDPLYYAKLTVKKARSYMQHKRDSFSGDFQ